MRMPQPDIARILRDTRVIAMVGASMNPDRPSFGVMQFLQSHGKRVIPVNPGHAGEMLLGEVVYASLKDIPQDAGIDMVDVFRRSDAVADIATQALADLPHLRVIWLQLGVKNDDAASLAAAHDVTFVQDRCPAIEWRRLGL
jgi:predicted CoA-binding protein